MPKAIPASAIVTVNPGVIGTGGTPLAMNGVILSTTATIPTGKVLTFASKKAVADYFGISSDEYTIASKYFLGFENSTIKPGTLYFAAYAAADRAAWLRSAQGLDLDAIKAASGTLIVTIDGTARTTSSISLSSSASPSAAAATIQAALITAGGTGVTVTWNSTLGAFIITSPTSGEESTISYASGTIAAALLLTQATGAQISQGIDADSPSVAMERVVSLETNWALFMTMFEPDADGKEAFAEWVNGTNQRYAYACWDTDANAIVSGADTTFGARMNALEYNGVIPISGSAAHCLEQGTTLAAAARDVAAFILGSAASIDFSRINGRITFAFKRQSGLQTTCADEQEAENLMANGYNFYGNYATANDEFVFLYDGRMPGQWKYIDPYVNQIYLNAQFQLALLTLLTQLKSIPYNEQGYALVRASMMDPIQQALNFGAIRPGINLSELQKADLNQQAGVDIDQTMEQVGWYLQILDPGAQVRGNRGTPVINFWYTDGGSIHKINVASIDVL